MIKTTTDGIEETLVLGTDYSVSGGGELSGGTVTASSAPASGEVLTISREMEAVQETDLRNQGKYLAQTHENVFDYLTMLIQQNAAGLSKAIRVAVSDPIPARLPPAASRANLLMGFNSSGDPVPVSPVSGSASDLALQLLNAIDPAKGAAMIGYRGRTVRDRLDDIINVKDFGAKGDGVTDDTSAFLIAITHALTREFAELVIPPGQYVLTSALNIDLQGICGLTISGAGSDVTELRWVSGTNGISVTTDDGNWWLNASPAAKFGIRNLSIVTTAEAVGIGLSVDLNVVTGRPAKKVLVDDVVFRGHESAESTWGICCKFTDCSAAFFNDCRWFIGGPGSYDGIGVLFEGSVSGNPAGFYFNHCEAFYGAAWISAGSNLEGIYLTNCSHVAGERALVWSAGAESGLHVIGGHYNNIVTNFALDGVFDFEIIGALLYSEGHGVNEFTHIGISNGSRFTICGNVFVSSGGAGAEHGVLVNSTAGGEGFGGVISGNSFCINGNAIILGNDSQYVTVEGNSYRGVSARVNNQGSNNSLLARAFSSSVVITTSGGSATETVNIPVPGGFFLNKPESAIVNCPQNSIIGYYDYDSSTATNLVFILSRNDGAVIASLTIRLSVTAFGSDA
ncbi:glycosyl hydrolase family 28-related protein [Azotobacter vinelandii]